MSMCVFDVLGNVSMESQYLDVYRKGQMLVIELVNNLIVPFRVVSMSNGGVGLYLVNELAFTVDNEHSAITVVISNLSIYSDIQFDLIVDAKSYNCSATAGSRIVVGKSTSLEFDVLKWCKKYGIRLPDGCVYSSKGMYINRGCDVDTQDNRIIVSLPGGLKFPILRTASGLRIAGINVERKYPDSFIVFIKVRSRHDDVVHFRISVWEPQFLTVLDDVVYSKFGVSHEGTVISGVEITKQLLLGLG